jgi:hypothetical protein
VETIFKLKSDLTELRKIVDELDEAANALAALIGHEESSPLDQIAQQVAPRRVLTSVKSEVGLIDGEQPMLEAAYHKNGPNGQSLSLAEPISESSARLIAAQMVESSPPDTRQTPDGDSPSAVLPMPHQMERRPEPSDQEIRLRAYFLSERRRRFALSGDAESDWHEAKRQLICESGQLGELSMITAGDSGRILRAVEDAALGVTVASAKPRVESIEQGKGMPYETNFADIQSSAAEAIPEPTSNFPNDVSAEPVLPQTTTLPNIPNTTQIPTTPVDKSPSRIRAKTPPPGGAAGASLHVTFSCEITAVQLTPTFKMDALTVRPASRLVTMHLALEPHSQTTENLQVSFEAARIQPLGGTLGTLRMLPSSQQKPVANDSPSLGAAGLQLVPNFEAAPLQLTASQPAQATVFVVIPCEINTVEFSPLFEIASVILNSSSKRVFVRWPGTSPGGDVEARVFEIANLQLTESGQISTMQLKLLSPADASVP